MSSLIPLVTIPDRTEQSIALERTTHLAVGAHPDDVEIIGIHGIQACFEDENRWFTGVVVANGSRSARSGSFAGVDDRQMIAIRQEEQINAAFQGRYGAMIQLGFESAQLLGSIHLPLVAALKTILVQTRPQTLYLHNPADSHATHVSVCLHALQALRDLPAEYLPEQIWGVEVWRGLDWVIPSRRIVLDVSGSQELQSNLLSNHRSQVQGGKRYDLAIRGRNIANATFASAKAVDDVESACFALDLRALVHAEPSGVSDFLEELADQLRADLIGNLPARTVRD